MHRIDLSGLARHGSLVAFSLKGDDCLENFRVTRIDDSVMTMSREVPLPQHGDMESAGFVVSFQREGIS